MGDGRSTIPGSILGAAVVASASDAAVSAFGTAGPGAGAGAYAMRGGAEFPFTSLSLNPSRSSSKVTNSLREMISMSSRSSLGSNVRSRGAHSGPPTAGRVPPSRAAEQGGEGSDDPRKDPIGGPAQGVPRPSDHGAGGEEREPR